MPGFTETVETEVWGKIYEEGWRMWREGLDRLRKSENGLEAAKAKQLMDDAERILQVPLRGPKGKVEKEAADKYKRKLKGTEEAMVKKEFETSIKGKDDESAR
jgi:hypothetical protein